jgi:hypothetical protein
MISRLLVRSLDGVEYIHNPGAPLRPGLTVEFAEELSFGGGEEPGEAALYQPRGVLVDENDFIYINDYRDAMIRKSGRNIGGSV